MITIQGINYYIGNKYIFNDISMQVNSGDRIGLVGLNGSGKTTLLKMIHRDVIPDSGKILRQNNATLGYLNQDLLSTNSDKPIIDIALESYAELLDLEKKIHHLSHSLLDHTDPTIIHKLADLQHQFELNEGYAIHSRAEEILEGIGFKTNELTRPLNQFSGGWRMRVMLAKLLLQKPSLLMLDEPTNHLDLPSILWLENYLRNYDGSLIVVSHDGMFLDKVVNKIIEIRSAKLYYYKNSYSEFLKQKELELNIQKNSYENQQKLIRDTEKFIERFRAKATKARQVQSRIKSLEKLEKVEEVVETGKKISFHLKVSINPGKIIMDMQGISKNYGSIKILENDDFQVERGDKIGLIGANGLGKSTLLRILAGSEPFTGERKQGFHVIPAFYAQHQLEALNPDNDLITELTQSGSGRTELELRTLLGAFLFSGDDIFKKIRVLSGGEKARVALAKTMVSEANFLLLDEPTNHLDYFSIDVLQQALRQYTGSFVMVSHDRNFINRVCNKIWYIENYRIKSYQGNYSDFENRHSKRFQEHQPENKSEDTRKDKASNHDFTRQKELKNKIRQTKKEIENIETGISQLEFLKKSVESGLEKPENYSNPGKLNELIIKTSQINQQLEELHIKWETVLMKLEELEKS